MKKLMKKLGLLLTVTAVAVTSVFGLTACGDEGPYTADDVKIVKYTLTSEEYAYGVKKNDATLLNSLNTFLTEKSTEVEAIKTKYFNATTEELDNFGFEAATVANPNNKAGELVVITNTGFQPFEYKVGNKFAGIDMEIAKLFAEYLNQKLVIIDTEFDAVVTGVQSTPEVDIAMAGLTVTEDRKASITFANTYYDTSQVIVVKKGNTLFDECKSQLDVENKLKSLTGAQAKCGGQNGTTSEKYIKGSTTEDGQVEFAGYANLTFGKYQDAGTAVTDMMNGNIEFVLVDKAVAEALVKVFNFN